ncbi:hypothetical protein EOL05_25615, partial [Escherichia coli]
IRASVSVPILTSSAANVQIIPVAVMFRYRTFQKSFIPLASRQFHQSGVAGDGSGSCTRRCF